MKDHLMKPNGEFTLQVRVYEHSRSSVQDVLLNWQSHVLPEKKCSDCTNSLICQNDFHSSPPVLIVQFINEPKETMFVKTAETEINVLREEKCYLTYVLVSATFYCRNNHFICYSRTDLRYDEFYLFNDLSPVQNTNPCTPSNSLVVNPSKKLSSCFYILKQLIE
jgi:hypothetical protein